MPSVVAGRAALAPARMIAVYSGGLPIRQKRQLPKARHGAGARPVHCEFFLYLINNLVSDFVTWLKVFFCFYCITVRPAIYLCLRPEIW